MTSWEVRPEFAKRSGSRQIVSMKPLGENRFQIVLQIPDQSAVDQSIDGLRSGGISIEELVRRRDTLEEAFLDIVAQTVMKAYLAVLKDSFREALASRVLWILLALTTLVLAAVSPIGLSEKPATQLRRNSILNMSALLSKIEMQGLAGEPSPGKQIWSRWDDDLKTRLVERGRGGGRESCPVDLASDVLDALNKLLPDRTFYDPSAWRGIDLNDETKALAERGADSLSDDEVKRRNRLLLEVAYPTEIAERQGRTLDFIPGLAGDRIRLVPEGSQPAIKGIVAAIMSFFVGTLGVLGGDSRDFADHPADVRSRALSICCSASRSRARCCF